MKSEGCLETRERERKKERERERESKSERGRRGRKYLRRKNDK